MFTHHTVTHAGLALVHAVLAFILFVEASLVHAACVGIAACLYAGLCWRPPEPGKSRDGKTGQRPDTETSPPLVATPPQAQRAGGTEGAGEAAALPLVNVLIAKNSSDVSLVMQDTNDDRPVIARDPEFVEPGNRPRP